MMNYCFGRGVWMVYGVCLGCGGSINVDMVD